MTDTIEIRAEEVREIQNPDQLEAEKQRKRYRRRFMNTLGSTANVIVVAAAMAILVATLWMPVLQIYGSSMAPTLEDGQIVVSIKNSEIKWEKRPQEELDLKLLKVWSDSSENLHSNDAVTIEVYKDGVLYDTVTLSKDKKWECELKGLDVSSTWTVKEVEFKGYISTVERNGDCFIITNILNPVKNTEVSPGGVVTPGSSDNYTKDGTGADKGSGSGGGDKKLPQTGQLWWPVPLMFALGLLAIVTGLTIRRRGESDESR